VAAKAGGLLVMIATVFLAWTAVRAGAGAWVPGAVVLAGAGICACLRREWRRARGLPACRLEAWPDGSIWLRQAGAAPAAVTNGRGTRLLGPSVFLDLRVAGCGRTGRLQCWLTPFDAPQHVIRQWSVALPRGGRVART
jgi:hypothetical protein